MYKLSMISLAVFLSMASYAGAAETATSQGSDSISQSQEKNTKETSGKQKRKHKKSSAKKSGAAKKTN